MKDKPLVSIVIPVYNEEKVITDCLKSLKEQSWQNPEIIIVDDGSTDESPQIVKAFGVTLLKQNHKGPGPARNLGAKRAKGQVLVFVDADMTFEKNFVKDLVSPVIKGQTIGTFSKNEMVKNQDNIWSRCWNINKNLPEDRMIPQDYPSHAPVFRAILKTEFDSVGGFEVSGQYTDDWSLSRKLGKDSTLAPGAYYYHANPSSLGEVWKQARWIGKNEFISGSLLRQIRSLIFYSLSVSLLVGIYKSIIRNKTQFIVFKLIYDFGIWVSVIKSFFGERKAK
ncbi:MAG: glycosyltransferase family 2 protein [Candidatus Curtissbacteria bacterium]|nr:glycosyltransferase family 2 protein [Candidatus Curtissbacteria bacterium]